MRPRVLTNLGGTLRTRFTEFGDPSDLAEAITTERSAVAAARLMHLDCLPALSNLGAALAAQYELDGKPADLDEAITLLREAVAAVPEQSRDRPGFLSNLGAALLSQFERTNELPHVDEAIAIGREAVKAAPSSSSSRPEYLSNLSGALRTRFDCVGQLDDLDAAVRAGREAVESTTPQHYNRRLYLSNLSAALGARFEQTGQSDDLDEAVAAARIAVTDSSPSEPDRPMLLLNLSGELRRRFDHTEGLPDLAEAISTARDAVDAAPPDHPDRPMLLANLAGALGTRFNHTEEPADLDMAIALEHEAVEATSPEHHHYAAYLSNYGASLGRRFEHTRRRADLDTAITMSEDAAAATPSEHPERARCLSNLGAMLQYRFTLTGKTADLDAAITAFRDATRVVPAPPGIRMLAGQRWGHAAADAQRFDSAADGFEAAVTLLPLLAWHGLPPDTRQHHLTTWSGLAADAAACAVRAGRHERAVELLDAGRSVLWTQTLNLRTDLSDLAEAAAAAGQPELVDRLGEVRRLLDAPLPDTVGPADEHWQRLYPARRHAVDDRIRLARELDSLLARVRALSGFEHFLLPQPFSQLGTAAADGPVVIVNTSRHGCHALVIEPTGVQVLDLRKLIHSQVIDQARRHRRAVASSVSPRSARDLKGSADSNDDTVLDVLGWLWDTVAEPVLSHLGHTRRPPADVAWPRLWWCPAGPMTMLPLHAAGRHRHQWTVGTAIDADTVPDRVVSSYAPTLTSLRRARTAVRPAGTPRLLAVGMPTTPDASDLPDVPRELDGIQHLITTRLQNPIRDRTDSEPPGPHSQPTIGRVLTELPNHAWLHLACHGSQHPTDPTASAFHLADGPLRISDLIDRADPGPRELAFLSACQTATGSTRIPDEALHLAAAIQLIGYRHVIATQWSIVDSTAPDIAHSVYEGLASGTPSADNAARALHNAVTTLRALHPAKPVAWAPYLHTGP
jgi:tetratricopeptide (TPR) repeat protein